MRRPALRSADTRMATAPPMRRARNSIEKKARGVSVYIAPETVTCGGVYHTTLAAKAVHLPREVLILHR